MLSPQAISTALDQVQNFEGRNVVVRPLAGSVLDSLVKACHVNMTDIYREEDGSYTFAAWNITAFANQKDTVTGNCEHTLCESEFSSLIGNKIVGYISHAKTIVAPAVEEFVKNLEESLEVFRGQIAHDFEISTKALPGPLSDDSILDSIDKFGKGLMNDFTLPAIALPASENGLELIRTGSTNLDAALETWLKTAGGVDKITEVWNQLFAGGTNVANVESSQYFNDSQEGMDRSLIAFLITRKLWDNPPEGTSVSLNVFNERVSNLRDQVAARLTSRIAAADRAEKTGSLVLASHGKKIFVNQPVYTKWLKAGGTNEVLFGNALKSIPDTLVEAIDANSAASQRAWDSYAVMKQVEFQNRMFTKYREMAALEFARTVNEASHDEMPLNEREGIVRRFDEALAASKIEEIKDVYCWSLRLLATSWFYKTDAYRILKDICEIRAANPKLDVREAAAVAAINYISYWVSSQLEVVRPGNNH